MAETVETAVYKLRVEGQDQIDRATRSVEGLATAEDKLASANRTTSASMQRSIAQLDPLIAAQEKYLRALKSVENARERGVSESQLATRLALEKKAYDAATVAAEHYRRAQANAQLTPFKSAEASALVFAAGAKDDIPTATAHMNQLGNSTKVARYEMINLGRQANDVIVSLASGQGILTVGLQQGSQILDVFTSSERTAGEMFKQMGSAIMGFVTNPLTLAVGITAGLVTTTLALANAWDKVNVNSQRAISGAGARTGTTVSDINAFVNKNTPSMTTGAGLSQNESRALAEGLTQTGDIVISKLHDMSNAVMGFSNQTKKSMDESVKAFIEFGKDPAKAMDQLAAAFGPLGNATRDMVEHYLALGDKTAAFNVLIDATAAKALTAAQNMGVLEKAGRGVANALQTRLAPTGLETQLEKARQELDAMIASAEKWAATGRAAPVEVAKGVEILSRKFEELQARQQAVRDTAAADVLKNIEDKARAATDALIPQNEQLKIMETRLNELKAAQDAGVGGPDLQAAITAQENLIAKTREAKEETARYNERVKEISKSWGDVGQGVALQLQALQNQLPVAQAVGGLAKINAQYQADINDGLDKGLKLEEATALAEKKRETALANVNAASQERTWQMQNQLQVAEAVGGLAKMEAQEKATINALLREGVTLENAMAEAAAQRALTQAQINTSAKETLWNLRNQLQVIEAVTGKKRIEAQEQATINKLVHDGVSASIAAAVAEQEAANARAAATTSVKQQVEALKDSTEMIKAQQSGTEATTAAAQAYRNAIKSGADSTAAAALQMATLENYAAKAAGEVQKMANSMDSVSRAAALSAGVINAGYAQALQKAETSSTAAYDASGFGVYPAGSQTSFLSSPPTMTGGTFTVSPLQSISYTGGGRGKNLDVGSFNMADFYYDPDTGMLAYEQGYGEKKQAEDLAAFEKMAADAATTTADMYELNVARAQANNDPAAELAALQSQLGYYQGLTPSTENYSKIASLQDAIESLITSTDTLNSTNETTNELLSPYYEQDPRTSHIGFRSQGMAAGGYVDVPGGYSANDNMMAMVPVASGERIYVDPMTNRRGTAGGGMVINISSPINIYGNADADQFGRTVYQNNQLLAKQVRAASQ